MKNMITLKHLSKDYGNGKGIFDVTVNIRKGEVFGIVGVNGAGKTTTLRLLMGFLKASQGRAQIAGLDVWKDAAEIKKLVGYVPGEIAFPDTKSGQTFLKLQLDLLKEQKKHNKRVNELIQKLKIDLTADIKRMSKGMKQKVALVCAFMTNADVLLLDEPTTGLDPVMRDVFIDLVKDAKKRGTTIIMSSHMFNELEPTCDRIAFLKAGKIVEVLDKKKIEQLHHYQQFEIEFESIEDYRDFKQLGFKERSSNDERQILTVSIYDTQVSKLLRELSNIEIKNVSISRTGLDHYFADELASN
ncbi:ABC transporter ATP-binding protein [Streptococcus equinus]|uniref:ABC transporter ATP-binding protein n=1 Tax=Streptococcus equinus TaxID=1335 RepID=UPI00088F0092|nr:ATP-binding cassette domain-containing protein [Streptococcus equinus]SDI65029.1 ABC-2 type transport system ATP-binding protein [Streptococcus equinus]SEP77325.1 ABC-2 type transport system ATP-binding protein [Streptococcus equinus]